ncbi:MAG: glycosyltransferase [Endomicrobia bacterium]|nr:glycosyltransferase [Endomicrobiia bacterium]
MKKIDLHIHSKYSEHPSEWFLQRLGAAESYTEPEFIFKTAKERGMDFVTITDHNRIEGALLLKERYPNEVITGIETTAYFPEDGCKIHILLFGIDEKQYEIVQKLRNDVYQLREWIRSEKVAYSVSHPIYSVNGKLGLNHLEKLIILFDVFEGLNAGRTALHNDLWVNVLKNIETSIIEKLFDKYKIEPFSLDSHKKAFTGGSDDHAGIFIAKAYTLVDAKNTEELLEKIRNKEISFAGKHNDFKSLAFTVYKIAYDFSKTKSSKITNPLMESIVENLFRKRSFNFFDKVKLLKINFKKSKKDDIKNLFIKLTENLKRNNGKDIEAKLDIFYKNISDISDAFIKIIFNSFEKDLKNGNFVDIIKNLTSSFIGVFLSIPFFSSFKHLNQDRDLLYKFKNNFSNGNSEEKNILWFSDTINDLNGVSVTIKKLAWQTWERSKNLIVVSSFEENIKDDLPPNIINLSSIYNFHLPYYEQYILRIPSILKSLEQMQKYNPDEIYISTPGPMGLLGLLMSKIFGVKSVGVFHTDFTEQAKKIVEDDSLVELLDTYVKWFYSCCDRIEVPSDEYINILKEKGFEMTKLRIFRRGIDLDLFSPKIDEGKQFIKKIFGVKDDFILLYVGRISKDKNLKFLIDVYAEIIKNKKNISLLMIGDGPYKDEIKDYTKNKNIDNIILPGKIKYELLPYIYSGSDLFLFPSNTDTFGMVVLEAQACGLPAIVSDKGGPKNIIIDGETGFVAKADSMEDWIKKAEFVLNLAENNSPIYKKLKNAARMNIEKNYLFDLAIENIFKF